MKLGVDGVKTGGWRKKMGEGKKLVFDMKQASCNWIPDVPNNSNDTRADMSADAICHLIRLARGTLARAGGKLLIPFIPCNYTKHI